MKRIITIVFLLGTFHLFAQIYPASFSPVKVGNMQLQTGKVFFQNTFDGNTNLTKLGEKIKSKEQVYSVFNINAVTPTEIKGTITNYQMNIDQFGIKRKKLCPFLAQPLNAIFNIENINGKNIVVVKSIWFKNLPGSANENHQNIEAFVTGKNATTFLKNKKILNSIAIVDKNLEELFKSAISGVKGNF